MQPSVLSHERSAAVYGLALLFAVALLVLAPRIGSLTVSVGGGLAAGGALATLVCGLSWREGVPNPLVRGDVAFNLADVAIAIGVAMLVGGALAHGWRNRARLHDPV